MQQMLLHGERRKEQSQTVIEGHVQAVEQAHMVLIRGIVELSRDKAANRGFRMVKGTMRTYTQNKLGLSAHYDKQWVLPDGIHTEPAEYQL